MKPEAPSRQQDKFVLRMPDGMRDRISAAAKENGRSMNAEISYRLSLSVPSSVTIRTQLRMPADLHNRIQDACKESGRSMNAETVYRLQESFE